MMRAATTQFTVLKSLAVCLVAAGLLVPLRAYSVPSARPEAVGFSSERLQRIADTIQRHIDARNIAGAGDAGGQPRAHRTLSGARPDGSRIEEADDDGRRLPHHVDDEAGDGSCRDDARRKKAGCASRIRCRNTFQRSSM
jgi:hypothetical protein